MPTKIHIIHNSKTTLVLERINFFSVKDPYVNGTFLPHGHVSFNRWCFQPTTTNLETVVLEIYISAYLITAENFPIVCTESFIIDY